MQERNKYAAVVVWYDPTIAQVDAIALYADVVNTVYIVDNSLVHNSSLLDSAPFSNYIYLPQMQNTGIATALNIGTRRAIADGAEWVLTMDQDSRFDQTSFADYLHIAFDTTDLKCKFDKVAIFAPFLDCDGQIDRHHRNGEKEERLFVMTSGNLLRAEAYNQTQGWRDDFFIDWVDDEMCMQLHHLGWHIVRCNNAILTHSLGEKIVQLFGTRKTYISHPAHRYFYIARNAKEMKRLYPELKSVVNRRMRTVFKRLLLYDWNNKHAKLREWFRGIKS